MAVRRREEMHHQFRLEKSASAKRSEIDRPRGAEIARNIVLAPISLIALLLFLNTPANYAGIAFAAASETEAKNLFHRAALKLKTTGQLLVIAFGTSSTQGARASSPDKAYPAVLEKYLNAALGPERTVNVLNRGIGGQNVYSMMERLERDVLRDKPDIVIWQTGTNDPLHNIPLWRFILKTREGIQLMQEAGVAVVLMEPQDSQRTSGTPKCLQFRDAVRAIGEEMGLPVIRRFDLIRKWLAESTAAEAEIMHADGLHMADEGYRRLAVEVAAELIRDLAIPVRPPQSLVQR
jgi:acyl-CoA thioesterase I